MTGKTKQKRGLGRGLDALFQDSEEQSFADQKSIKPSIEATKTLSIGLLTPGEFQPRHKFDQEAIDQLAESISSHGILQPILVRPISDGEFEIIAGERRWRAAQKAQLHEVPVIIQELSDKEAFEIALIENLQRQDLTILEEAQGYQRLIAEFSYSQEQLGKQLSKSRSHIANIMRLLKLPDAVKTLLDDDKLSAGHARALLSSENSIVLAELIVKKGLNVRQTEKLVADETAGIKPKATKTKTTPKKSVDVLALEEELSSMLGLKVTLDQKNEKAGKLVIEYKSLDQLDSVLERISSN